MTPTVAVYGALELQRNAQRFWLFGFGLSVLIHLTFVASYYMTDLHQNGGVAAPPHFPPGERHSIERPDFIPGIAAALPSLPHRVEGLAGKGTPVPINDPACHVTLASQGELASAKEPVGEVGTGEVGKGEVIIPPEEELEPPPFRPVQIEPRVVLSVTPDYPRLAVETGLEGKVWVKIWLDHSGKPRKAVILKGDAEVLNEAALAAAMKFIFTPAIMNDRPVSVWVAIPFSFKLH